MYSSRRSTSKSIPASSRRYPLSGDESSIRVGAARARNPSPRCILPTSSPSLPASRLGSSPSPSRYSYTRSWRSPSGARTVVTQSRSVRFSGAATRMLRAPRWRNTATSPSTSSGTTNGRGTNRERQQATGNQGRRRCAAIGLGLVRRLRPAAGSDGTIRRGRTACGERASRHSDRVCKNCEALIEVDPLPQIVFPSSSIPAL